MFKGPGSDPVSMMEQGSDEKTRTRYLRTDQLHDYQRESSPTPLKLYNATQSKRHIYLTRSRLKQLKDLPSSQCPVHGKLVRRASEDVHERISRHNDTLRNARSFRKMLHTPKSSRSKSRFQLTPTPKRVTRARRKLLSSGDETKEASKPRRARSRSSSAAVRVRRVTRSQKYRISKPNQNADFIYFPVVRSPAVRKRTKSVPRKQKNEEKDVTRNTGIFQKLKNFASNIKVTLGKKGNPSKGETIDVSNSSHVQNSSDVQWVELNSSKLTNQSNQSVRQSTNQRMDYYVGTTEDDLNVTYQPVSCFGRQKFTISKSSKSLKNKRVPTPYKRKLAKETARMSTPLKPRQLLILPSITNREKGTGHDAAQTSSKPGCDGAPATMTTEYTQEPNRNAGNSLKQKLPQEVDKCTMTSPQVNVNESGKQTTVASTMYQSNYTVKVSQAKSHQEMQTCEQSKLSTGVVTNGSLRRCVSDSNAVKLPRNIDASERCMVEVTTKKVMTMGSVQTMTSSKARQPLTVLTTGKGMATTQREVKDSGTFQKSAIIKSEIKMVKVQPLSDPKRRGHLSVDEYEKEENESKQSSSMEISQLHSTAIPTPVRVASTTPPGRNQDRGTTGIYSSPAAANIEPKATIQQLNHTERVLIKLPSITKPPRRKSCQSPLTTLDVNRDNIATANEMVSPATKSVKATEVKELITAKAQIERTNSNEPLQGNKVMADTASKENPKRDLMTVKMTWPQTIPKEIHAITKYSQTGEPHVTVEVIKKDKTTVKGKDTGHVQRPSVAAVLTSSLQRHTEAQRKQGCNRPSGNVQEPQIPVMGKKSSESPLTPESLQSVTKVFDTQSIDDKTLGAKVEKKGTQGKTVEKCKIKESAKPQMSAMKVSAKIVKENTAGLRLTENTPVQRPFEMLDKIKEKESAIYETMDQTPSESADMDYQDKIPSPPHQNTQRREEKDEMCASEEMLSEYTRNPQLKMKKCDGKVVPEDLSEISPEVTKENGPSKKLEASSSVVSSPAPCDTTTESTKKPTMYDASKGVISGKGKTSKPQAIVSAKPTSAMKNTCEYEKPANPTYVNRQTPHLLTTPVQHQTVYFQPFTPAVGLQQAPFLLNSASQNILPKYLGWNKTFFLAYTPSEFAPYDPDNLTKYQSVQRQDRSRGMIKQQPVYDSPDPVLNQRPYYTSKSKNTMSLVEQFSQSPVASDVTYLRNISHTLTNRNPEPQSININTSIQKVFDLSNNRMTARKECEPTFNGPRNHYTECMYEPSKEGITTKNADSSTLPHLTQSDLAELSLLENKDYRPSSGMLDIPPTSDYLPDEILDLSDKGSIVRQWEDKQPRNDLPQWENNDKQPRNDHEEQTMQIAQGAKAEDTNKPAIIKSKSEEENTAVSSVGKTIRKMTESCESLKKMSAMKNGKSLCLTIPSITQHRSFLEDKLEEDFSSPSRESSSSSDDLYRSDSQTTSRKRLIESDESEVDERPFADPREKLKPGNSPTGPVSKRQKFEDKIDEMITRNEIILSTGTQMEFEDDYNLRLAKVEQAWTESCARCSEVEKFLDVRPHYIKGRPSFRYVKHLLRMVEYSRTADMVNVYTGKVKDWILQCAIASSGGKPHTLARDLVWRLFTIGELYGKRVASLDPVMIKIVKENVMAVTNCSEIIWQRKCVPFVNSNIQKLFHSKLKEASIRHILDHKCTST